MKRIRKGALGTVLIAAGTILSFLGMANPARTAAVFAAATSSSSTLPTTENAYCAKGDIWTGGTSDGPAELPQGCVYTGSMARRVRAMSLSSPRAEMSSPPLRPPIAETSSSFSKA